MIHDEYLNTDTIDAECATLNDEIEIVSGLTKKLIAENATTAIPQDEYNRKYDALVERYHAAQDRLDELQKLRITRSFQADVLECFMFEIKRYRHLAATGVHRPLLAQPDRLGNGLRGQSAGVPFQERGPRLKKLFEGRTKKDATGGKRSSWWTFFETVVIF